MAILLAQPALLLIDFGHFQYNSVMLGRFISNISKNVVVNQLGSVNTSQCQLYVQGAGPRCCGFLRCKSLFQADGVVLRTSNRVVLAR